MNFCFCLISFAITLAFWSTMMTPMRRVVWWWRNLRIFNQFCHRQPAPNVTASSQMIRQVGKKKTAKKKLERKKWKLVLVLFSWPFSLVQNYFARRHLTEKFLLLGPLTKVPTISIKRWVDLEVTGRDSTTTQWSQRYRKEASFSFRWHL